LSNQLKTKILSGLSIGVLAIVVLWILVFELYRPVSEKALAAKCRYQLHQISVAVAMYVERAGCLPSKLHECTVLVEAFHSHPRLATCPGKTAAGEPRGYRLWVEEPDAYASMLAGSHPIAWDPPERHGFGVYLDGTVRDME
jgi:hypothetical protein